jgi:hypothetical protein
VAELAAGFLVAFGVVRGWHLALDLIAVSR